MIKPRLNTSKNQARGVPRRHSKYDICVIYLSFEQQLCSTRRIISMEGDGCSNEDMEREDRPAVDLLFFSNDRRGWLVLFGDSVHSQDRPSFFRVLLL